MGKKQIKQFLSITLVVLLSSSFSQVRAQQSNPMMLDYAQDGKGQSEINRWGIQLDFGFTQFHGNLSDQGFFGKLGGESPFANSLIFSRKYSPLFTLRGQLLNASIASSGPDEFNLYSNDTASLIDLRFNSNLFEYNLNGKFDLSYAFWGTRKERRLTWYGMAGIGFANWRTSLYKTDSLIELSGTGNAGTGFSSRTSEIVFPLGMGLEYKLGNNWKLHFEQSFHIVNSDILDAYEGGSLNDMFTYTSFGISYSFSGLTNIGKRGSSEFGPMLLDYPDVEGYYLSKEKQMPADTTPSKPKFLAPEYEGKMILPGGAVDTAKDLAMQDDRMEEITIKRTSLPKTSPTVKRATTFHVQILATRNRVSKQVLANKFNIKKRIIEYYNDDLYRYAAGTFDRYTVANTYAKILHEKGVYDAFVIAYRNGKRVGIHIVR